MRQGPRWIVVALASGVAVTTLLATISPSSAAGEVRLTAAGDFGARSSTASVLDEIADIGPDAHLAVGDLAYGDSADEYAWCSFVKQRVGEGFPFQLVSGNHESEDVKDGEINNFSACLPNQIPGVVGTYGREYYMDFPTGAPLVRVIQTSPFLTFLDGRWTYSQGDAHYNWLAAAIDDGRAKGAEWIIVTSHFPCQSVASYSCSTPRDFYNLLLTKHVDLVLHGHEHSYARTHQLRAGVAGCATMTVGSFNPACVADSDSAFIAGLGSVFATVGTGGTPLRNVNPADTEAGYFAAWSGLNSNPTYGLLDIRISDEQLAASFVPTSGGNFTDTFTITKGEPPASTTTSTTATSSTTTTLPASTTTTSTTTTTLPASTTTTSTTSSTSTTSTTSTTTQPPVSALASDSFTRALGTGWGTANAGGAWTVSTSSAFSVNGTAGRVTFPAGSSRSAYLRSVRSSNTDMRVTLSSDKIVTGNGLYTSVAARSVTGAQEYRGVLRMRSDGRLALRIDRSSVTIAPEVLVPTITYAGNVQLDVRVQATGTFPTTIRAKVWPTGTAEPASWLVSTTDNTASMQTAGSVGFNVYLSSSASNAPITLSFDDLLVIAP